MVGSWVRSRAGKHEAPRRAGLRGQESVRWTSVWPDSRMHAPRIVGDDPPDDVVRVGGAVHGGVVRSSGFRSGQARDQLRMWPLWTDPNEATRGCRAWRDGRASGLRAQDAAARTDDRGDRGVRSCGRLPRSCVPLAIGCAVGTPGGAEPDDAFEKGAIRPNDCDGRRAEHGRSRANASSAGTVVRIQRMGWSRPAVRWLIERTSRLFTLSDLCSLTVCSTTVCFTRGYTPASHP